MDPLSSLRELAGTWHEEAELLRRRGAPRQADALESAAEDLVDRLREWSLELLSLEEAAKETGLAYDTVQRKVSAGDLPNAGERRTPKIRRADLHPWLDIPSPMLGGSPVEELAERTLRSREAS